MTFSGRWPLSCVIWSASLVEQAVRILPEDCSTTLAFDHLQVSVVNHVNYYLSLFLVLFIGHVYCLSWLGVLVTTLCVKVCQWLATGLWFSHGTPVSSTNKTARHDITEILLKIVLKTINHNLCSAFRTDISKHSHLDLHILTFL